MACLIDQILEYYMKGNKTYVQGFGDLGLATFFIRQKRCSKEHHKPIPCVLTVIPEF